MPVHDFYRVDVVRRDGHVLESDPKNSLEWALQYVAGQMCVYRAPSDAGTSITVTEIASGVTTLRFTYTGLRWAVDAVAPPRDG